ncbi:MAG: TGS domain-containing protein [bacterium]
MPANLPPNYYAAEKRFREESDPKAKVKILKEMLAIMPKHKGTDHLQGDIKKKISKYSSLSQKKSATKQTASLDNIPREGVGQISLVGLPNSGKSLLINYFTNVNSKVANYPFSTFKPFQGMMQYEDINIQIIDLPPISLEYDEQYVHNIIRLTDLAIVLLDLTSFDIVADYKLINELLGEHNIYLVKDGDKRPQGTDAYKSTLVVGTKCDIAHISPNDINTIIDDDIPSVCLSLKDISGTQQFAATVFQRLNIIRIYTKAPGQKKDFGKPYILQRGSNVYDAAEAIHKELAENMKYARIWSRNKYDGQRVDREYILNDGDIIEIHNK